MSALNRLSNSKSSGSNTSTHHVHVTYTRNTYNISITSKFTVIAGDSGTGRSGLYRLIQDAQNPGSNVILKCDLNVLILPTDADGISIIAKGMSNTIFFFDESTLSIYTDMLNDILSVDNGNYYVVITRNNLDCTVCKYSLIHRYNIINKEVIYSYVEDSILS